MYISSQSAKNMAAIILTETQGGEALERQLPLNVIDQGDRWLVCGTPYDDKEIGLNYCQFYVIFLKNTAEITGLGSEASLMINPSAKQYILDTLSGVTEDQLTQMFGPRKIDQMDGSRLKRNLEFSDFLYGGLINTPSGAIDYASNLLESSQHPMVAEERSGVWYISRRPEDKGRAAQPILSFERLTGRVLSCTG